MSSRSALRAAIESQRRWPVLWVQAVAEIFAEFIHAKWLKEGPDHALFARAPCKRGTGGERNVLRASLPRDVVRVAIDLCADFIAARRDGRCRV